MFESEPGGTYSTLDGTATGQQGRTLQSSHVCEDVSPGPGGLLISHRNYTFMRFSGVYSGIRYANWHCEPSGVPSVVTPAAPSPQDTAKLLARSNPSRPVVDLPVFFAELRDLPSILKSLRERGPRWLAGINLSYQFGIQPLVNDLVGLLDLTTSIEKRKKELTKLLGAEGLRSRVSLGKTSHTSSEPTTVSSEFYTVKGVATLETSSERWGTTRWAMIPGKEETLNQRWIEENTYKVVLGLNPSLSQLWELLPWSWMIDYFSNVGDVIASTRNVVQARAGDSWVMMTNRAKLTHTPSQFPSNMNGSYTGVSSCERILKYRAPAEGNIIYANLPFLTVSQTSIIASLFITRHKAFRQ